PAATARPPGDPDPRPGPRPAGRGAPSGGLHGPDRLPGVARTGPGLPPGAHLARAWLRQAGPPLRHLQPDPGRRTARATARPQAGSLADREWPAPRQGSGAGRRPEYHSSGPRAHGPGAPPQCRREPLTPGRDAPDRRAPARP